ncbi:MAG: VCBS repeat-containing protein [Bacteroidetes bacterium]|nr:VCBS repeat-containing protein [Bacteroidota bacterium]
MAVSDLNLDDWPDLYVGNDFHEDDYLYLNSGIGTFNESLWNTTGHSSRSTMGIDIADINNDGLPDIIALDMLPSDMETQRTTGHASADAMMRVLHDFGYGPQVSRNTLQLHRGITSDGIPYFSEIGVFAGIDATDWSWSPLIADFDGDGWKDLYITNGIPGRPNDLDYIEYVATSDIQRALQARSPTVEADVASKMPAAIVSNVMFQGINGLQFSDVTSQWGFDARVIGNGAAYGDLDLDGDLDLVINALNHPILIYRNESTNNYITVQLSGTGMNTSGLGAKVHLWSSGIYQMQEQFPSRGFQSSVNHALSFGLGTASIADSLVVIWPSGLRSSTGPVSAGTRVILHEIDGQQLNDIPHHNPTALIQRVEEHGISFSHIEDQIWDFEIQPLLPYWRSAHGAAIAVGDVNGDGLDDLFFGGARDQTSELYILTGERRYRSVLFPDTHKAQEVIDAVFFDADADGDQDLYIVTGGWTGPADLHQDRIYMNSGDGNFKSAPNRLPSLFSNGTSVATADFDLDGDIDIFVGSDTPPASYGEAGLSTLLENDGKGYFTDVTDMMSPTLHQIGHVTDVEWVDLIGDSHPDLVLVGEWIPVTIFENLGETFVDRSDSLGLSDSNGLWQSLSIDDLNADGYLDLVVGNLGSNTVFESPLALFAYDFDQDGLTDPVIAQWHHDDWFVWASRDALLQQLPILSTKIPTYHSYKDESVADLFGHDFEPSQMVNVLHSMVFWNQSGTSFISEKLPSEVQWAPAMAINTIKSTDGSYAFISGNISSTSDAFGSANASWGSVIHFNGDGDMRMISNTGYHTPEDTRQLHFIKGDPIWMIVSRLNTHPLVFELSDDFKIDALSELN